MTSATAIVEAAGDLAELIEANADDGERIRRLPLPTVKALRDAQLLRMCVPQAYGGPEVDPVTLVRAIEAVAGHGPGVRRLLAGGGAASLAAGAGLQVEARRVAGGGVLEVLCLRSAGSGA